MSELVSEFAPLHPRNNTFPGEAFLRLAADALDCCGASREEPLTLEGIRERFPPECTFRGRQNRKLQFAVLAAAALRGGTEPDLLGPGRVGIRQDRRAGAGQSRRCSHVVSDAGVSGVDRRRPGAR